MISKVKVLHLKKAKGEQPFCRVVNLLLRLRDTCPRNSYWAENPSGKNWELVSK